MRILNTAFIIFFSTILAAQTVISLDVSTITKRAIQSERYDSPKASSNFEIIDLPMPSGEIVEFVIKHSPLVKNDHPLYNTSAGQTYRLHSPTLAGYNGSMVIYKNGIHATLNTPEGYLFIKRESIDQKNGNHLYTYFKDTAGFPHSSNDAIYPTKLPVDETIEHTHDDGIEHTHNTSMNLKANNNFFTIGGNNTRRVVDLFVLSEKSFVDAYQGNTAQATARVVEIVNGTRAFWEQDFNITINYMGVYFDPNQVGAGTAGAVQIWNSITDANIPNGTKADVDLAHLFAGNGGGGAANLWVACDDQSKASGYSGSQDPSETSFIPLVAHELAHQMGADHTWTGQADACTFDQWGKNSGVEPGSGNTLAGYAGICGSDNIPGGKGDYHHIESMREILFYVRQGTGKNFSNTTITQAGQIPAYGVNYGLPNCINTEAFTNAVPQANANPNNLININIPARTPFELDGSATDADGDPVTYQWDQLDFALAQQPIDGYATRADGPLFRSYGPSANTSRVFPKLNDILTNTQVAGEILPQTNRPMRFALVVRDGKGGVGVDTVGLNVVDSGEGFAITEAIDASNPTSVIVNWNVANTTVAPINCDNVTITYSTDGGQTFPHTLIASTPNNGAATVNLSAFGSTTHGRIKVKCATGVFFDINNTDLSTTLVGCIAQANQICSPVTVTAVSGDASLDLDETDRIIGAVSAASTTLTVSANQGVSITDNNGACGETNFGEYYAIIEFTVSATGSYSISDDGSNTIAVLEQSNYTYDQNNPCMNSGTFIGANFTSVGGFLNLNPNLTSCTNYTLVITNLSPSVATTINFAGPGNVITSSPMTAGTSYTFIAVNAANNIIARVDANADFRSLTSGTYSVFGVSYQNVINTAGWVGQTTGQALSTSTCAVISSNSHTITVTGGNNGNPCSPSGTTTVAQSDLMANTIFHNGTIKAGVLGAGKVNLNVNNVTFRAVNGTELIPEFEVTPPNIFNAEIAPCPPGN